LGVELGAEAGQRRRLATERPPHALGHPFPDGAGLAGAEQLGQPPPLGAGVEGGLLGGGRLGSAGRGRQGESCEQGEEDGETGGTRHR
jgi:hypothetical protein